MLQENTVRELQELYDAYIIDLWGVVHNGVEPYSGVVECLNELLMYQKAIVFLSNAPRPSNIIMDKLLSFGISVKPEMMLTSGDITRETLEKFTTPIYHLGAERNQDILAGLNVSLTNHLSEASLLLITAYLDAGEDLDQYDTLLQEAYNLKLPAICANPDKEIINGNGLRYCSGIFAEKYTNLGGFVQYFGKPYITAYQSIFARLKNKNIVDKKRILMIGDTLETDIVGAKTAGIDSALVLTGNISTLLSRNTQPNVSDLTFLSKIFQAENVQPTWILSGLKW